MGRVLLPDDVSGETVHDLAVRHHGVRRGHAKRGAKMESTSKQEPLRPRVDSQGKQPRQRNYVGQDSKDYLALLLLTDANHQVLQLRLQLSFLVRFNPGNLTKPRVCLCFVNYLGLRLHLYRCFTTISNKEIGGVRSRCFLGVRWRGFG
jgi:hypothetical protein